MSHRYNLRSKKNIILDNIIPKEKIDNKILVNDTIQRDDIIYGDFNEALCSNTFKEDLLNFITKWKEFLPNITDKMVENIKKTDYIKKPYDYFQINTQIFEKLKEQSIAYLLDNKKLLNKKDYDSIKTVFTRNIFNEEITNLVIKNTVKHRQLEYAKHLKEKIQKISLDNLKNQLFYY